MMADVFVVTEGKIIASENEEIPVITSSGLEKAQHVLRDIMGTWEISIALSGKGVTTNKRKSKEVVRVIEKSEQS